MLIPSSASDFAARGGDESIAASKRNQDLHCIALSLLCARATDTRLARSLSPGSLYFSDSSAFAQSRYERASPSDL